MEAVFHGGSAHLYAGGAKQHELCGIFPGADAADTANGHLSGYGVLRYGGEELEGNGFNGGTAIAAESALSANVGVGNEGIEVDTGNGLYSVYER